MPKGKWAQGIVPRNFVWVLKDRLAVCERPGGYGSSHRRVRRQEEIIWIREQGFSRVVSLCAAPSNLHSYDEAGVAWSHHPLSRHDDVGVFLEGFLPELHGLLEAGEKVLLHGDEVGDDVCGVVGAYLRWSGVVSEPTGVVVLTERLFARPLGPRGREFVYRVQPKVPGPATGRQ
ncbi:MAG: hypothetical protein KatS3mg008_1554 [Acidimicrobiales bacterium]|nr:MAG: hypothetical protein KatS3mg008_1554 [Acidimicrobiales bacterium]